MRFLRVFLVLVMVGLVAFFVFRPARVVSRVNVLVGTSPVSVWSWDKKGGSFTVLFLPATVAADSVSYGRYSLEALWKLGFIDKRGGMALSRSLSDALALPIPWFLGEGDTLRPTQDIEAYGRRMFSPGGVVPFVFRQRRTNMPFGTWLSFSWALARARPGSFHIVDLTAQAPVAQETLPDGTVREFLDTQRIDLVLKGRFEDEAMTSEAITVGVYNTTTTPALGTYAARMLMQAGILVVAVGNSEPEMEECVIEASDATLKSHTAGVIAELFSCRKTVSTTQERADLVVRLGRGFATRFSSGN